MSAKRFCGPAQLSTSATTVYTAPSSRVSTVRRGRVSNPTGSVQTFTMSIGADAAGTRLYSATPIAAGGWLDIYGPFTVNAGTIIQAYGSSSSLVLELSGNEEVGSNAYYVETFSGTSNPLGAPWITGNAPYDSAVQLSGGDALGTQTGTEWNQGGPPYNTAGQFNDSIAFLDPALYPFPSSQRVQITMRVASYISDLEIEGRVGESIGALRSPKPLYGPTNRRGLESNLFLSYGTNSYKGAGGALWLEPRQLNADAAFSSWFSAHSGLQTGDIFCTQLDIGSGVGTMTLSIIRGATEYPLGNATHADFYCLGQPGFGFYRQNNPLGEVADPTKFTVTKFEAWGL